MAPGTTGDNVNSWDRIEAQVSLSAVPESVHESNPSSMDHDTTEPLAIVGLSLRFPQEAVTENDFWGILMQQKNTSTAFPDDRLSGSAIYHPDSRRRGTVPVQGGHFVKESIAAFDSAFFAIPVAEAAALDPQQRGLLETTYRALENAGMPMEKVYGSKTSVLTGCFTNDWQQLCLKDAQQSADYAGLGVEPCMNANRISWFFNFTGTSVNLDSACSSSLVALDVACKGLRNRDADMSIVAGSNLIFSPDMMYLLSNMSMLSPNSQCFSFDHRADGYARGEGFGALVVKRLSDAIRDGDTIRTIIRETGSNQDGFTPGISQPSSASQEALIRDTYSKAGLSMGYTRFVEAHGTGTAVGDPIEATALGSTFRRARTTREPLYIGAVKSNIGHLEGASGIAGVIKTILVLEKAIIPPNTNFEQLNPRIDTDYLRVKFPIEPIVWPSKGLRRASVNSFGFGGTNAHVILDDAFHYLQHHGRTGYHNTTQCLPSHPGPLPRSHISIASDLGEDPDPDTLTPKILVFSTFDEKGMKRLTADYLRYFRNLSKSHPHSESLLADLAHTLCSRRSSLRWKSFMLAASLDELRNLDVCSLTPRLSVAKPSLGLIFTGQGAQWACMGRELTVFAAFDLSLRDSEQILLSMGCVWLLREELFKDPSQSLINRAEYSQPLLTAVQIALIDLLDSWRIRATAVVGHSSGEIAAAYCVGAISAKSALKIAYHRGQFAETLSRSTGYRGAMMSVGLSEKEARSYMDKFVGPKSSSKLTAACINSPKNVTISGESQSIYALKSLLDLEDIFARILLVDVAYHSPQMEVVAAEYAKAIESLESGQANADHVTMISSITGKEATKDHLLSPQYWVSNMISPVRFSEAMEQLCNQSARKVRKKLDCSHRGLFRIDALLEVGPHSALEGPTRDIVSEILGSKDIPYTSCLIRKKSGLRSMMTAIGKLHCLGFPFDLEKVNGFGGKAHDQPRALTDLPQYPFDHSLDYWHESRISRTGRLLNQQIKLDLLGSPVADWNPSEAKWRNFIRMTELPWVEDHIINGTMIYPAAGMLVMAIEAMNQMTRPELVVDGFDLKNVVFHRALTIPRDSNGVETHFHLRELPDKSTSSLPWSEFRLYSFEQAEWHENCHGLIRAQYSMLTNDFENGSEGLRNMQDIQRIDDELVRTCNTTMDQHQLYTKLNECGFGFGPSFQRLRNGFCNSKIEARAEVDIYQWPDEDFPQPHVVHPTTLDGILHLSLAALAQGGQTSVSTAVPSSIKKAWISKNGLSRSQQSLANALATLTSEDSRGFEFGVHALDHTRSHILVQIEGLRSTIVADSPNLAENNHSMQMCYHLDLRPDINLMDHQQLRKYCTEAQYKEPEPTQFYQDLTFVMFVFLTRATVALEAFKPEQPHLRKYLAWAHLQLEKYCQGSLPHSQPEWVFLINDEKYVESVCGRVESANDQGRVFVTTGRNLLQVLRGQIDPLDFLFSSNLLRDLYREINENRTCFPEFERYLDLLAHQNPNMKILEIGAGTGGTTTKMLRTLKTPDGGQSESRYSSYAYTDISQSFFETAQGDFRNYPRLLFSALDIESDPVIQGYSANSYDLIVAANVLHATKDIKQTLRNVRSLLKPDGKLVMYEPTQPDILRTGFVAGLLEGWWLAIEDFRPWGPSLTTCQWNRVLKDTQFSGLEIELPDFVSEACQEGSILITTALAPVSEISGRTGFAIIVDKDSSGQMKCSQKLCEMLRSKLDMDCVICTAEEAVRLTSQESLVLIFLQELEQPILTNMSKEEYEVLQILLSSAQGLLWVTGGGGRFPKDPAYGLISGLSRSLRNENANIPFVTVALEISDGPKESQFRNVQRVIEQSRLGFANDLYEPEYVEIDSILHIPRAVPAFQLSQDLHLRSLTTQSTLQTFSSSVPLQVSIDSPGMLDSIRFIEDELHAEPLAKDEIEVQLRATGITFRDCHVALGRIPGKTFGKECAGVVTRVGGNFDIHPGDSVYMYAIEACKTYVKAKVQYACKIPGALSFAEAASIPLQFSTAWQILSNIARIGEGERILIHAGAGGTGQAVIQIAMMMGAEIFVTVGSTAKKQLLIDRYGIPSDHILYSRDSSFGTNIMRMTNQRGADVIVGSATGDVLAALSECLARYGRFVLIRRRDIATISTLPVDVLEKNASFTCFDVFSWLEDRPAAEVSKVFKAVHDLFARGKLHVAQPLHINNISDIAQVFRSIQDGGIGGKNVLEVTEDAQVSAVIDNKPNFTLDSGSTYLIAGGLGGLGRSIARWMVSRGARNLVLLSRSGPHSEAAKELLHELKEHNIRVETPSCDVVDTVSLQSVLENLQHTMPPIKGCVQASMVLRDSLFADMSYENWKAVTECKTTGSWNLHTLLPRDLSFFVLLSSASGVVGLRGQANYAAGNTYMDALARLRVSQGEKAIALDLGAMTDDGLLAETPGFLERVLVHGALNGISRQQASGIFDYYCNPDLPVLEPTQSQSIIGLGSGAETDLDGLALSRQLLFSHIRRVDDSSTLNNVSGNDELLDYKKLLITSRSRIEAGTIVSEALAKKLSRSLSAMQGEVDMHKPLHSYGVDSLLAVELRSWISRQFAADVPVFEIQGGSTLATLGMLVASKSKMKHAEWTV